MVHRGKIIEVSLEARPSQARAWQTIKCPHNDVMRTFDWLHRTSPGLLLILGDLEFLEIPGRELRYGEFVNEYERV